MTIEQSIGVDYPFSGKQVAVKNSTLHYVDVGTGDPILFLHGNPTWSYLWRNIVPYLQTFGRCIAPDLIGMGRSGKPDMDYRFVDHARYIESFIDALHLKNITLVMHGWGSVIGFDYARRNPSNIKALAFMESLLMPFPSWDKFPEESRAAFQQIRSKDVGWDMLVHQNLFIEQFLPGGVVRGLTPQEMTFYREPFLKPESRKPIWCWPNQSPIGGEPREVVEAVDAYNHCSKLIYPSCYFMPFPAT